MRLTEAKAKAISIELWTWLAEDGERDGKCDWPGWADYGGIMYAACPLCQHTDQAKGYPTCTHCIYYKKFRFCCSPASPYFKWDEAGSPEERVKYATEFLEQLRTL